MNKRRDPPGQSESVFCVPGMARLLNSDVRYYDTHIGQSPDPARRRRRVAEGKGVCSDARLKEAGGKGAGRRTGMPRTER